MLQSPFSTFFIQFSLEKGETLLKKNPTLSFLGFSYLLNQSHVILDLFSLKVSLRTTKYCQGISSGLGEKLRLVLFCFQMQNILPVQIVNKAVE